MKFFSNKDIAKLLREISAAYLVRGENNFKVIAYQNAADNVKHLAGELKDIWDEKKLNTVPGLGKSIQEHLDELFRTGHVKHFDEIKKELPPGMFELLDITGMGPKSAFKLASKLKLKSVKDLQKAAESGKIRELEGFGVKSEQEILTAIGEFKVKPGRHLLTFAYNTSQRIIDHMNKHPATLKVEPMGSLRRMVATIGDVDIGVASKEPLKVITHFKKSPEVSRVLGAGTSSSSILLKNRVQIDLKVQPPEAFGSLLQHFTGSKSHNIHLRELALKKGMSLSEQGITHKKKLLRFSTEESFYDFLGLMWIPPEMREDSGEIQAAIKNELPDLIELKDIKGDIHLHSDYPIEPSHDLGKDSMEKIVQRAVELGYAYVGLSDHSPGFSTHTKTQMVDLIKKRKEKIEQIKDSFKSVRILNLLEIDILKDEHISVPEEGLKLLDGAIAGIHSSHRQPKEQITRRLLAACNSPFIQVISHPTGRLLLERESYEADWPKVFETCAKTGTILEINSWPNRLDLPDLLIREALKYKVKFIINSDSHAIEQMDNIKFGVSVAKRGWATKNDIINTLPWLEFSKHFRVS